MKSVEPITHRRRALLFIAYFASIALYGSIVLSVYLTSVSQLSDVIWSEPGPVIERLGAGDAGSYLSLAVDLATGTVRPENAWVLNLWPPGMAAIETILLWLPGPIVVKLAVLSVSVWACAGAAVAVALDRRGSRLLAAAFVVAWCVTAPAIGWVFGRGFAYTDGIGAALLSLATLATFIGCEKLAARPIQTNSGLLWLAVGGVLTGMTMYFRWALAGAVAGTAAFALGVALTSLVILALRSRRSHVESNATPSAPRFLTASGALVFALGSLIVIAPWTTYVSTVLHPGNPSWSMGDYQWGQRWLTDEQLSDAKFLVDGNANWACEIAPVECAETYNEIAVEGDPADFVELRNAAIEQALSRPGAYLANRGDMFFRGWFSSPGDWTGSFSNVPSGIFFAAMLIVLGVLSVVTFRRRALFVSGVWVALAGMVAIIAVAHLEPRYLISIHITTLVSACLLATLTGWKFVSKHPRQQHAGLRTEALGSTLPKSRARAEEDDVA